MRALNDELLTFVSSSFNLDSTTEFGEQAHIKEKAHNDIHEHEGNQQYHHSNDKYDPYL